MQLVDEEKSDQIMSLFKTQQATMATGGSASNTINAVAKLGTPGGFIGKINKDTIGNFYYNNSLKNGVEPHLLYSHIPSGHCTVLVSPDGERTLCTYLGAASELYQQDLDASLFSEYDIFHIEGYLVQNHDLIHSALRLAKEANMMVSIDLASFNVVEENREFLRLMIEKYVDITFANEEEAIAFSGTTPEEALNELSQLCDIAVVKFGKEGSLIKQGETLYKVAAKPADCIDTTGAGDMYAAGFLHGLTQNYPLNICGKIGSLIAAKVIEVIGAKVSDNTWDTIYADLEEITKNDALKSGN